VVCVDQSGRSGTSTTSYIDSYDNPTLTGGASSSSSDDDSDDEETTESDDSTTEDDDSSVGEEGADESADSGEGTISDGTEESTGGKLFGNVSAGTVGWIVGVLVVLVVGYVIYSFTAKKKK